MNKAKAIEIAKTCLANYDYEVDEINKLFKDCLSCSDCEFCFPHDLDNFICAGNDYGKIIPFEKIESDKFCDNDISFETYSYLLNLIKKYGIRKYNNKLN